MTLGPISLIGHFRFEAIDRAPEFRRGLDLNSQLPPSKRAGLFGCTWGDMKCGDGLVPSSPFVMYRHGLRTARPACSD